MNLQSQKLTAMLSTILLLMGLIASPALMQTPRLPQAEIRPEPFATRIDPSLIQVRKRPPVQFKAFEVQDPTNRKPISRETILTLPDGKKIPAGTYYDELNKLESQFNALGYTLKDARDSKIELQVTPVAVATLERQSQTLRAAHLANTKFQQLNLEAVKQEQLKMTRVRPDLTSVLRAAQPLHWNKDWNYTVGDPSVFSAFINGHITLDGTQNGTTIDGAAKAGGSMFSHSFDLLQVTSNLNAPRSGNMNVKVAVSVVGSSVYNLNQDVTTSWTKTDSLQKTLDKSVTYHFSLGPIPMTARMGVQGTAGISYGVAIAPTRASANLGPFVHTKVYAQIGADIVIGGAGAGANLTLLNTDGSLNGAVSIEQDAGRGAYYKWNDSYSQSLNMLNGNVYVYAYIYVPCWGLPPWCKKEWDWTIFSWGGFSASGTLFSDTKTLALYPDVRTLAP